MQNSIAHAAERKAFRKVLKKVIEKSRTDGASEAADELITFVERIIKGAWADGSFDILRRIAEEQDSKWARYTDRLIRDSDPELRTP